MPVCELCKLSKGAYADVDQVLTYVVEAAVSVHDDEIAAQASARLRALEPAVCMDPEEVKVHMHEHMLEQRVVLVRVLRDMLHVAKAVKSIAVCEGLPVADCETDSMAEDPPEPRAAPHQVLDSKAMAVYLKVVDQITGIYKMPSMSHLHAGHRAV